MARYFFDTSALAKYYHTETGSGEVGRILSDPNTECFVARLTLTETLSSFAKRVRLGLITSTDYRLLEKRFRTDLKGRLVSIVRMLNRHFETAGTLIGKHGHGQQVRTLDALQLAVALHLHQSQPIDHFVCADQRLSDVARLEGLSVLDPETS